MPVILTTPEEVETWMTASPDEALKLQRPLPDGVLQIVARGDVPVDDPKRRADGRLVGGGDIWFALDETRPMAISA